MPQQSSFKPPQNRRGNAHDALFTYALTDLQIAQDFLAQHLPTDLYQALDLRTLEICKDKFIDPQLKAKITDILYRIQLQEGENAYVSVLVEHQSTATEEMPLRVFEYQMAIMRHHWNRYHTIPLIHTLVYYNGTSPWTFPCDLKQQIKAPPPLIKRYALQPFQLLDLTDLEERGKVL